MLKMTLGLLISTSMLSACYGFRGPQPVLSASGVVREDHRGQPRNGVYFQRFRALALRAAGCTEGSTANSACGDSEVNDPELMRRYMRAGFALVYADCDEYMAVMARHHGRARIGRDLITPLTNLITGILSLHNLAAGDRQDWLTGLTIGSSAGTAALNIVDQRFLFGSDNIDVVRGRVTSSLGGHADTALARPNNELNFERASIEILNNQALCTPSGILRLTRNAIQSAPVTANNNSPGDKQNPQPQRPEGMSGTTVDP